GDVAIINHIDIDKVSAEALVACRPSAVGNAATSISGRYPNLGPEILLAAGIPLLDAVGEDAMEVAEGTIVHLDGDTLMAGDTVLATGRALDDESVVESMAEAREGLNVQLEASAANTMEYLK